MQDRCQAAKASRVFQRDVDAVPICNGFDDG
jgi:hypothetical protein